MTAHKKAALAGAAEVVSFDGEIMAEVRTNRRKAFRVSAAALLDRLAGVQGRGPRWRAICPAHQSKHGTRSLAIAEAADGRVLIHCHAGCDVKSIVGAVGLDLADLFPPKPIDHHRPRIRKPWRARDVVAALKGELMVAFVILAAVAAKTPVDDDGAERAGVALERIALFLREIEHAG